MVNNYGKLRGRIIEKYKTIGAFANSIGVSRATVSNKFNGKSEFSRKNIQVWGNALNIDINDPVQVAEFFLT